MNVLFISALHTAPALPVAAIVPSGVFAPEPVNYGYAGLPTASSVVSDANTLVFTHGSSQGQIRKLRANKIKILCEAGKVT